MGNRGRWHLVDCSSPIIETDLATNRALVALGHRILVDVYKVMKFGVPYKDVGAEVVYQRKTKNREQL